ncbi:MMPL family transporter [Catellatospora sp. NPDC049609]|uniref:MMPL family transporter n=1 Tax=Catellatospora sp. NPDC049609 TaxID=3155505 RepID=UPI00342DD6CC
MAERLAHAIRRYRWLLLAAWLVVLTGAGVAALPLAGKLSGGGWYVSGSDSQLAAQALRSGLTGRDDSNLVVVVHDERHTADSPEFARRAGGAVQAVLDDERLAASSAYGWQSFTGPDRDRFLGEDRRTTVTMVGLDVDDGTARRVLPDVQGELADRFAAEGLRVSLVSAASLFGEINKLSQTSLTEAELIAFPLILVILLWLYRSVVATAVSFVVSMTALGLTFGLLSLLAGRFELSIFVQNAATMIGLGVSVDYSLIIISRYAEELRRGRDRFEALVTTLRTSGETVLFSGLIVVLSTSALFLVPLNVIGSIALGIVLVVAFAVLSSVVVLPVVLYLLGDRVLKGAVRLPGGRARSLEVSENPWYRLAMRIMRRPVLWLLPPALALLALAVPGLGMSTFTPDARVVPASSPVRFGYDTMRAQFGPGAASPLQVVVTVAGDLGDAEGAALTGLAERLRALPHVARVDTPLDVLRAVDPARPVAVLAALGGLPADARQTIEHFVSADRHTVVLEVIPDDHAASPGVIALYDRVRAEADRLPDGLRAVVGGETAEGVDANAAIADRLPYVLVVMLLIIYVLLLVTFRSLLLPLKAIVLNLLSVGATFGLLAIVFQHGFGVELLGTVSHGYVQNFVPILLLAILFGLSTDYEVFLLHRVREEWQRTGDDTVSVATGLARTAPLISGAAVLMLAVFGAFTLTGINPIQQLGFGLAVAVALDATLIRLVIVPASMRLMGRWNWWLPGRRQPAPVTATPAPAVREDALR